MSPRSNRIPHNPDKTTLGLPSSGTKTPLLASTRNSCSICDTTNQLREVPMELQLMDFMSLQWSPIMLLGIVLLLSWGSRVQMALRRHHHRLLKRMEQLIINGFRGDKMMRVESSY